MSRKPSLLNVRVHLNDIQEILDGLREYGYCPVLQDSCRVASLVNRAILRKHEKKATRKDLYVPR